LAELPAELARVSLAELSRLVEIPRSHQSPPGLETNAMKNTLLVLCFLCTAAAFGQSASGVSVLNNQPQMVSFVSHSQRASQQPMSPGESLLAGSSYSHAQGVRPLWEVAPISNPVPLGDTARNLRKEHATAKKAKVVWDD
jgi:hypothetical protein